MTPASIVQLMKTARLPAEPERLQALADELETLGREIRGMNAVDVTHVAPAFFGSPRGGSA